ncbi:uncharacterized protein G2W53_001296 [Senna tora]|uniref:Uncharacterized protein n=1 Tax=Senna tora TaxID=362788 RepID=A0A835CIG5_9FABA|nr:uncharacterized protein G2W53_001296 [Senna tora]
MGLSRSSLGGECFNLISNEGRARNTGGNGPRNRDRDFLRERPLYH